MRIKIAVPDELDDKDRKQALNAALEAVTISNEGLFHRGKAPKITGLIKAGKVKWQPEPPGDEHFDLVTTVAARGWGDCDDLAPAYAGQLRATGVDPGARAFVKKSGPDRWHALVRRSDGTVEDPSKAAGMGHRVSGDDLPRSPIVKPMSRDPRMCIAMCPSKKDPRHPAVFFSRLDVPSVSAPWAWTSMAAHPDPTQALVGCIRGARIVGEDDIDGEDDARLAVLHDIISGADPYEVACALQEMHGDDLDVMRVMVDGMNVGSFFKNLGRGLKRIARPLANIASKAVQFVPGVGPIASSAIDLAAHAIPAGGGPRRAVAPAPALRPVPQAAPAQGGAPFNFGFGGGYPPPWAWGPATWGIEPGQATQPWGRGAPHVMRF